MGDREYRPWILEQVFSGLYNWTLFAEMKQAYVNILMFVEMPTTV